MFVKNLPSTEIHFSVIVITTVIVWGYFLCRFTTVLVLKSMKDQHNTHPNSHLKLELQLS